MSSKGPFWEPRAGKAAVGPAPKTTPLMQRTLPNFGEAEEEGDRLPGVQGSARSQACRGSGPPEAPSQSV